MGMTGSYWRIGGCSGECTVDGWHFQEIDNFAGNFILTLVPTVLCVRVDDATSGKTKSSLLDLLLLYSGHLEICAVAAVISIWVWNVDFSLSVLSNWPFLQQSVWVNAQRMKCVIQTEGNKITAGSYFSCRHLVVNTPISSGWVFFKLSECWETSVTNRTLKQADFYDLRNIYKAVSAGS
jgi:hypothetical protein